ncbi:hypothetical protein WA026_008173 [Henosepilachna vigintioctopunctata]|uniref:Uncharacterized protein n=1 Tax=Henosepilachna vigintioctopunctata TaxID=420089 RepID=A0AAW1TPL9_9CUCU
MYYDRRARSGLVVGEEGLRARSEHAVCTPDNRALDAAAARKCALLVYYTCTTMPRKRTRHPHAACTQLDFTHVCIEAKRLQ